MPRGLTHGTCLKIREGKTIGMYISHIVWKTVLSGNAQVALWDAGNDALHILWVSPSTAHQHLWCQPLSASGMEPDPGGSSHWGCSDNMREWHPQFPWVPCNIPYCRHLASVYRPKSAPSSYLAAKFGGLTSQLKTAREDLDGSESWNWGVHHNSSVYGSFWPNSQCYAQSGHHSSSREYSVDSCNFLVIEKFPPRPFTDNTNAEQMY